MKRTGNRLQRAIKRTRNNARIHNECTKHKLGYGENGWWKAETIKPSDEYLLRQSHFVDYLNTPSKTYLDDKVTGDDICRLNKRLRNYNTCQKITFLLS